MTRSPSGCGLLVAVLLALGISAAPAQDDDDPPQAAGGPEKPDAKQLEFFEKKIRPVLTERCYKCHSAQTEKQKGGLALDTRSGIRNGGDSGPALVPGKPGESLLVEALRYQNRDFQMPPKSAGGKLSDSVVQDFVQWIEMGAPDPRDGETKVRKSEEVWAASKNWWAWKAPQKPAVPAVKDAAWPRGDLDRFVLAGLEAKGLRPVADADRATLLRRVHFDLVGLPPSPEQVEAFVKDRAPDALERVVDELLRSPQFGERWGRHWLDVARYAESSGKDSNIAYPHAWRYRDWVIDAFNRDLPYDQFVREQIAGDLLPGDNDADRAAKRIATGFLAVGAKSLNEPNPRQFRYDVIDEQIDALSQAFLGMTIACARCHDHKFDPIPQREYYAVAGIFLSSETRFGTVRGQQNRQGSRLVELPEKSGLQAFGPPLAADERSRLEKELSEAREKLRELIGEERDRRKKQRAGGQTAEKDSKESKRPPRRNLIQLRTRVADLENRLASYDAEGKPKLFCMGVEDLPRPRNSPLLARGEISKAGEIVQRGFVGVVFDGKAPVVPGAKSGRLELANWITAPENPLVARVLVNRVWHWLFGLGIVASVDNFGSTGQQPSNQELLDFLALRFREEGWSMKKLIREIVLSRAYGLASTYHEKSFHADPDNTLLWRHSKRRLDAESIRDAILSASGTLELKRPLGSPVAARGDGPVARRRGPLAGGPGLDGEPNTRSVYLPIVRDAVPEVLDLFDFAEPSLVTGARESTNVPAQALFLLNSPVLARQARLCAERLERIAPNPRERLDLAFRLLFNRPPTEAERRAAQSFFDEYGKVATDDRKPGPDEPKRASRKARRLKADRKAAASRGDPEAPPPWTAFCRSLFASAEFRCLD